MKPLIDRLRRRWRSTQWSLLGRICRTLTVRTKQGVFTINTGDHVISRLLFLEGQYQRDLVERSISLLRERQLLPDHGSVELLDIGANNGVISIGALLADQVTTVIGLEPDPDNFELLQRNIVNNRLSERFIALPLAASDTASMLHFELSPDNFGDHRIRPTADGALVQDAQQESHRDVIQVVARPIDDILDSLPDGYKAKIALVWMDVQGHEGRVLAGGMRLFSTRVPLVTEVWPYGIRRSGGTVEDFCVLAARYWPYFWTWRDGVGHIRRPTTELLAFCEDLGYDVRAVDDIILTI